ncbi:hypothetical protein [Flavisericum labens]|uniref:hypothetical protein n=1 Tax=Flavisericum labens TaxID=3377112 RepID=UPI00387B33D3
MNKTPRRVKFSTIFNTLKKRPIPMLIGFLFTLIPVFLVIVLTVVFSTLGNETPSVDFDLVNSKGEGKTAKITDLETQYNITINGVHPTIIHYTYQDDGQIINSKYRVLEERKINNLEIGDDIEIKEFEGSSIIEGLKPYEFGIGFILFIPIPFLIIGLPFLIYSLFHLRKEIRLYKNGELEQGKIVSMIPKSGLPISNIGQGVIVHYEYVINGRKTMGESMTTDFSVLGNKQKGDLIPIFVSTENPEKSCIVPKLEALRNNWNIEFE